MNASSKGKAGASWLPTGLLVAGIMTRSVLAAAAPAVTPAGIPLDAPCKVKVYPLARDNFHHPAWGWQHSVRDYLLALRVPKGIT